MAWQDRIQQAAYTAPGHPRLLFQFEDVAREVELRGTAYDFVGVRGSYIQGTGTSGRTFPLRIFISGPDYDQAAEAFFEAIRAQGVAVLEHPAYGTVNVVPMGRIRQRDDLKSAAGQAVFEVVFWETLADLYPSGAADAGAAVLAAVEEFNTTAADDFAAAIDTGSQIEVVTLQARVEAVVQQIRLATGPVAAASTQIAEQALDTFDSINRSLGLLASDPATLAAQIIAVTQVPARASGQFSAKLSAYRVIADALFGTVRTPGSDSREANAFASDDLAASGALTGAILGAVNTEFATQPDAIEAAIAVLDLSDDLNAWREQNFTALGLTDTGASYQQWQEAAALTAGFLIDISFSLAQERTVVLDRPRTFFDLCGQLYGNVDESLDFFINSNNLSGDELIELPIGREVVYYV